MFYNRFISRRPRADGVLLYHRLFRADIVPTKSENPTVAKMIPFRAGSTEKSEGISPINFIRPEM